MNERIRKLKEKLVVDKYPLCVEREFLFTESYKTTENRPQILRNAKGVANTLEKRTIFIEDNELIVGNVAGKPMGFELSFKELIWPQPEIDALKKEGYFITAEDEAKVAELNRYWKGKGVTSVSTLLFDEERLWPFEQSGVIVPPYKSRDPESRGSSYGGGGWGILLGDPTLPDYEKAINTGFNQMIENAEEELKHNVFRDAESVKKAFFLHSLIIELKASIYHAGRFADLALEISREEENPARKMELEQISKICRRVPANPAQTFHEALQFFWFIYVQIAGGSTPAGRFDQYMYPFYQEDIREGRITRDKTLELLECLRIKDMQLGYTWGGAQREKWAGMAKWHNWTIGGVTPEGKDATNEITYLLLEAAKDCQTPHHTLSLRVHEDTPEELMLRAIELTKTGIGMPAFIGDKSYIGFLRSHGVPLETARNYALAGCLDCNIPGQSRITAFLMFIVTLVFDFFMHNGVAPRTGKHIGPSMEDIESYTSYSDFFKGFQKYLTYFMERFAENNNIFIRMRAELAPDAFFSMLWVDALKEGKDIFNRTMPFENGAVMNVVGMINVVDSLAAIKKLVFEENKISLKELKDAMDADWQGAGNEEIRKMCLAAPKFGNDDDYVDTIAGELYQFWADTTETFGTAYNGVHKPSAISITAHWPGGTLTGATPDGRFSGEALADGAMSPSRGQDTHGPTAVIKSALKINQLPYQSTLLNMKFHPTSMETKEDMEKLIALTKTYFSMGGKHVQFNIIDKEILVDAQKHPEHHKDLVVRVAGYSAYFIQLGNVIQDEVIGRTEHQLNI
ncbi:glycyl radical protein [Thermodesulfobacteriota bacterium]